MTREGLIKKVAKKLRADGEKIVVGGNKSFYKSRYTFLYSQKIVRVVLRGILEVMEEAIADGEIINLDGYMNIKSVWYKELYVNNPHKKGEKYYMPAQYKLKIKPGKFFKLAMQKYNEELEEQNQKEDNECS